MMLQLQNKMLVGVLARDVQDYIAGLDDGNNTIISVSHCSLNGDRILTMVVSGLIIYQQVIMAKKNTVKKQKLYKTWNA